MQVTLIESEFSETQGGPPIRAAYPECHWRKAVLSKRHSFGCSRELTNHRNAIIIHVTPIAVLCMCHTSTGMTMRLWRKSVFETREGTGRMRQYGTVNALSQHHFKTIYTREVKNPYTQARNHQGIHADAPGPPCTPRFALSKSCNFCFSIRVNRERW